MANNYGPGVSRVLDPTGRQWLDVIFQANRPPLDSEFILFQDMASGMGRSANLRGLPSGWLGNDTSASDVFQTAANWSNWFKFGRQQTNEQSSFLWANVNGWLIPVGGTRTGTPPGSPNDVDTYNVIALDPPPSNSGDYRIDYVFLEAWQARVAPNPSATNKPSASTLYRYGNVEGGFSFLADDLVDPALGFETTQRVQLQYRIRVATGLVGFTSYPDGFDPTIVKGQGAAGSPTAYTFTNMRQVLGDPGLWRAGDGTQNSLGTVDGYTYAIPIAAVFRRNSVLWTGDPAQNLNGGYNRNPTAVDRTGVKTFAPLPTITTAISAAAAPPFNVTLSTATNIPFPASPSSPVTIRIGDELFTYQTITGTTMNIISRAQYGTRGTTGQGEIHPIGSTVYPVPFRPDGLYADQINSTDILDLRHVVNPNGFDYDALLKGSLIKLMKGSLRSNWKRTGAGPQGPLCLYQDKITTAGVSLGVTKIDGPDNIRQIYSDAAVRQKVYAVITPTGAAIPAPVSTTGFGVGIQVNQTTRFAASQFNPTDVFTIPVAQLKLGLPGGDADQVRWYYDGDASAVEVRITGQTNPVPSSLYTVTPTNPDSTDDLVITLNAGFPNIPLNGQLYISLNVMYGPGRGVSRRPDALHTVGYLNPTSELLLQQGSTPQDIPPTRVAHVSQWSKYEDSEGGPYLPVTTESYADPGSKTVVLNPLRRVLMPSQLTAMDGSGANLRPTSFASSVTGSAVGNTTFTDLSVNFTVLGAAPGDALVMLNGPQPGRYTIQIGSIVGVTTITLDRNVPTGAGISWQLYKAQGLMPLLKRDGVTPKWTTTDPLGLFSGTTDPSVPTKNMYVHMPRQLVPGWGEYRLPLLWQDASLFAEGVNYMFISPKGIVAGLTPQQTNYVPYTNGGGYSYQIFSTGDLTALPASLAYNTLGIIPFQYAGMRKFIDPRGMGREGLELPPFYGIARLWGVFEASDYVANGSPYDSGSRNFSGGSQAKNLLRQNFDGPLFWVEQDEDGDSTFILNAEALDLSKSTNVAIPSFDNPTTQFVVEASVFGFDRDAFSLSSECRVVLTRAGGSGLRTQGVSVNRYGSGNNIPNDLIPNLTSPQCVLPAPPPVGSDILVTYSRTPYQGDAWGSQTNYQDYDYRPGSLLSSTAYQIGNVMLDQDSLTRPNQKYLEVLSSVNFMTTLGTGRLSGQRQTGNSRPQNVGYEEMGTTSPLVPWPPTSPVAPRPTTLNGALTGDTSPPISTEFLGASERLPLGALWRDKDFKGQRLNAAHALPLVILDSQELGFLNTYALGNNLGLMEAPVQNSTAGVGGPGEAIVHVDGEQGNYTLNVNYRVTRGGSAFVASGPRPGGEVVSVVGVADDAAAFPRTNVIAGTAYLVRNTVTNIGLTEVSAGDELMMLIVTTVAQVKNPGQPALVLINTNGSFEGWSAADLYRLEGRPLLVDHVRTAVDPTTIALPPVLHREPE